jgi:hypothetical protein
VKSSLEVSEIGYLTWWNFPKKAWLIILGELGVIASLSGWLYSIYLNNVYFQTYVDGLSPVLVPVLSVAFGISSASIATYLYLGMRRIRTVKEPYLRSNSKVKQRKTVRRPKSLISGPPQAPEPIRTLPMNPKPVISPNHTIQHKDALKRGEESPSNADPKKRA